MKLINTSKTLISLSILFYVGYNTYFGWNKEPINQYETICDMISKISFITSIILYVAPLFSIYEAILQAIENENDEDDENNTTIEKAQYN